ncbi:MAG TPA: YdeI/OmpD-associated family protein [Gemmatimonadaceae bacterium]|nr:YdeI/OmpD-associated family protein [Gemmatimonadaceae bacterium]
MGTRDPRIDTYIATAAPFARPILEHIRDTVHATCPDVEETMKWRMPFFMYRGMLCNMAAFRKHCAFGFWKGAIIFGDDTSGSSDAMGQFGRIESVDDLPSRAILAGYIRKAMRLNEEGVSKAKAGVAAKRPAKKNAIAIPNDLQSALRRNAAARAAFTKFTPSQQRDYIEWLTEAKREETRKRRLETAIEWISEGKTRNWKYVRS